MKGLKEKAKEWMRSLDLFSLENRRLRGDLKAVYSFLTRGRAAIDLFTRVTSNRTQRNSMKLCQGGLGWTFRKTFFTQRVVGHWNTFPREMVTAPSLMEFKWL